MVPCLKCGRYFCRVCESSPESVHYCISCYHRSIDSLAREFETRSQGRKRVVAGKAFGRDKSVSGTKGREAMGGSESTEGVMKGRGLLAPVAEFIRQASFRIRDMLATVRYRRKEGLFSRWARSRRAHEEEWRKIRERRKFIGARKRKLLISRMAERVRSWWRRVLEKVKKSARYIKEEFPIGFKEKMAGEQFPLSKAWRGLALTMLAGIALWFLSVYVFQRRWWVASLVIGVLLACGCVKALRGVMGTQTGIAAALVAVFSILSGDLLLQILYRLHVLSGTTIPWDILQKSESATSFYSHFLLWYFFTILVPAVAAAFLVGLWPLPLRPYWRGFGGV